MVILDKFHRFIRSRVKAMGGVCIEHDIEGYQLQSYELAGTGFGPSVVLLHGLGGSANNFFSLLQRLRSTWRKIYVPDLPGHGFSLLRPDQEALDIRGHQRIFAAYLDRAVHEPAALVGNSMGGAIVLMTATERPETLGLGLLAPAGAPLDAARLEQIRAGFDPSSRAKAHDFLQRLMHKPTMLSWVIAGDMQEQLASPSVRRVLNNTTESDGMDEASLRGLAMPILLVWGESEKILPADGIHYFRRALPPHARIEVMSRCGHVPMMEQPARTAALLEDLARAITDDAPRRRT